MNIFKPFTISLFILAFAGPAAAQTVEQIEAYERRIEEQQRQLDEMRRELEALKAALKAEQPAAPELAGSTGARAQATPETLAKPEPESKSLTVLRKNENLELTLSGRVHRMMLSVDDGANSDVFLTDSEQGPTMLRLDAVGRVSDTFTVGATLETGIRQNRPFQVSQDKAEAGTSVNVRIAEAYFQSARLGRLSMGRGFAAAWLAPEIDLSGTQFASLLPVGMLAPGMKFVDASSNSLSQIRVADHFVDVERLLVVDRVRYDSMTIGPGLQLSGSVANDGRWDTALRAKPQTLGNVKVVGGASYQDKPFMGVYRRYDAGISMMHVPTGLNLTVGGSSERLESGRTANGYVIKAGWLADLLSLGKTAFSMDYYSVSDLRLAGDDAESYGIFAVQKWPDYGLDMYAGFRRYMVERPDVNLKDIDIFVLGFGLSF